MTTSLAQLSNFGNDLAEAKGLEYSPSLGYKTDLSALARDLDADPRWSCERWKETPSRSSDPTGVTPCS